MASIFEKVFGSKPKLPQLPQVSLDEQQQKAIAANIAAAPGAGQLARLSQEQIRAMMQFAVPGFDQLTGQATSNIQSLLKGQIPGDVSSQVHRSAAAQALGGGYAGTGMGRDLVARDLGLTSLNLTQQGLSSAESWLSSMERLYSPSQALFSSMFITPQQEFAAATQERDLQYQRSWLQSQIAAMPDPVARGIHDTMMEMLSDYASMRGGGGGGGGGSRTTDTQWAPGSVYNSGWSGAGGQNYSSLFSMGGVGGGGWGNESGAMGGGTGALGGAYPDPMAGTQ